MSVPVVGLLSPGQMGSEVGRVLVEHGATVLTNLEGRSNATRERAKHAGISSITDDAELVRRSDLLLSILVPGEALATAGRVSRAMRAPARGRPMSTAMPSHHERARPSPT
ncbi:MAG: hypothetical protein VX733_07915 [Candidatus Latescibacterota bacterium]|nr:hypothetical protein [Candidatus Latescibacterota bacterium]